MSSATCSKMDAKTLRETREFYNQLFGSTLGWYNAYVHPFIYQVLCLIGVFANICIIVVLLRPQMRKNPFNLFLIAIAICDMTLMASYYMYKQVEICHPWFFEYWWIVFTYLYAVLSVFVHSASLWITVNMAVLRYLVLRNSANLSMPKLNTYSAATVSIVAAVIISLTGSMPNMLRYEIRDNGMSVIPLTCLSNTSSFAHHFTPGQYVNAYTLSQPIFWSCSWERFSFWTAGLMLKLIPCLLLTIFMTLLVRMLVEARERRLRLCQHGSNANPTSSSIAISLQQKNLALTPDNIQQSNVTNNGFSATTKSSSGSSGSAERTTAMLTIIVAVFLITELPQGILVMTIGVQPQLGNLIDLLSLLNSSVNFILYSTMSNLFRNEFLQTFGQLCCCLNANVCIEKQRQILKSPIFNANKRRNRLVDRAIIQRSGSINGNNGMSTETSMLPVSKTNSGPTTVIFSPIVCTKTGSTNNGNNSVNLRSVTVNFKDGTIMSTSENVEQTNLIDLKQNCVDVDGSNFLENSIEYNGDDEIC